MIRIILEYKTKGFKAMIKNIQKILYIKWHLKQCTHLCDLCLYWQECKANYDEYKE